LGGGSKWPRYFSKIAESANYPDAISRADARAAIEADILRGTEDYDAGFDAGLEKAVKIVNALPGVRRDALAIPDEYCDGRTLHAFRDPATDEISVVPAVAVTDGWQPIETFAEPTALSSGDGVLIACHDGTVGEAYCRNFGDESDGWWWVNTSWGDYPTPDRPEPDKWMPLPAAPSKE
jgi:hypothetical protein